MNTNAYTENQPVGQCAIGREEAQREVFRKFEAPIDFEDFLKGNPILNAEPSGKGCLGILLTIILLTFTATLALLL